MRSSLLLFVPEAEAVVGELRRRRDPAAAADLGAHVTMLCPFVPPPQIDDALLARLRTQIATAPGICGALTLRFDRVARFPGLVYLALANADEVAAKARALAAAWPASPPYEGRFPDPVPHLTIAHGDDDALAAAIAVELAPMLPLTAVVDHLALAVEDERSRWSELERFPLA